MGPHSLPNMDLEKQDDKFTQDVRVEDARDTKDGKVGQGWDNEKVETWDQLRADAITAEEAEHSIGLWKAFSVYRTAIFWSFSMSLVIIMEGYDTALLGNVLGLMPYRHKFGHYSEAHGWQLSVEWQTAVGQAPTIGSVM